MQLRPSLLPALAVFAVPARHQSFAQAALELHLTASAVSHHVRRLEEVLEVRLFLRHARGVRLTAEGRQLADAASAAFTDVAAVAHHLQPDADSVPLRIATLRSLSYCWLLPRLPRFTQAWFRHAGVRPPSPLPPMHTFADSTDAMRAAVYGMGAVLARTHVAQPYLQRYEVVRLPGPALKARYAYYVVHAEAQPPSPAARLFIDWLLPQAQDERTPIPALPDSLLGRPPTTG